MYLYLIMMVLQLPLDMENSIRIQTITELKNYLHLIWHVFRNYLCLLNVIWILKFLKLFLNWLRKTCTAIVLNVHCSHDDWLVLQSLVVQVSNYLVHPLNIITNDQINLSRNMKYSRKYCSSCNMYPLNVPTYLLT